MVKYIEVHEKTEVKQRPCRRYNFSQNPNDGHVTLSSINNNQSQNRTPNVGQSQQDNRTEVWGTVYQNRSTFVDMHLV